MLQSTVLIENPPKFLSLSKQPFIVDLVFDMVRFPVKSLQRFRSTCKPWNALISSDRKFAMEQLRRAFSSRCDCYHILVYVHSFSNKALTSYLIYYSLTSTFSIDNGSDTNSQPNGAFTDRGWLHFNGDSYHGLVLVTVDKFQDSPVLWNLTAGKLKILLKIMKDPMTSGSVHTWLCYDPSDDSYRVVEVSHSLTQPWFILWVVIYEERLRNFLMISLD
ncbi:hypothetical protein PIB30_094938 [Stylosanthes scabra]|uniref:F-box domain-containing protein n=1 Tax=Stylosanthes scabra TaxID=79078 RepID=A0ABU6RVJ5_9FABA|nr:hypothetical protein [Stylosanthes scabra]